MKIKKIPGSPPDLGTFFLKKKFYFKGGEGILPGEGVRLGSVIPDEQA